MSDPELINHLRQVEKINRRDLKALAELKLKLEDALDAQRLGHSHKWPAVQKQLDRVNDLMNCEYLATEL